MPPISREPSAATRVALEHRNLERFGDKADAVRAAFDSPDGWGAGLDLYAKLAAA